MGLIGKFKDFVPSGYNPQVRMNAIAGGILLTLEDCHFAQVRVEYAGEGLRGMSISQIYSSLACIETTPSRCNSRMCSYTCDTWSSGYMLGQPNP